MTDLNRCKEGWEVTIKDLLTNQIRKVKTKFIFIGAGGGSLPLLQKAGVPEIRGYGGFPIGGQWLVCDKPEIVKRHNAKVYGLSPGAAPTMAVPHLDSRWLEGKRLFYLVHMLHGQQNFFIVVEVSWIFFNQSNYIMF